jgi:nucleotide-binding universal stress UspA family protein
MKRVLFATDGSDTAQSAARFLAHLPHENRLEVIVVSVITPPYSPMKTLPTDWIETCREQDRERAQEVFAETASLFEGANASVEHVIVDGHAGESICNLAKSRECDLVVLGATGHSAVWRILLGSTSDYVATQACCSVLVVRPIDRSSSAHPLRICLGFENTSPARAALQEITEIKWGKQVEFHLVTVSYAMGLMAAQQTEAMREIAQIAARKLCESGFNAHAHLIENEHLGEGLVRYAEDHGCDIFVVGEESRSHLWRILMGSTSRYVIRHVPCSVWITRNRSKQ